MTNARKEITSLMARDTDQWQWGKTAYGAAAEPDARKERDQADRAPVQSRSVSGRRWPGRGQCHGVRRPAGVCRYGGPAMRMLVDLGDLDASRWVNQSGISGHAFHRHYDDQTELWANQRLWPFVSSRGAVEARTTRQALAQRLEDTLPSS